MLVAGSMIGSGIFIVSAGAGVLERGIQHATQDRVGTAVAEMIFGPLGGTIMAIAILISTFGCNNGLILAGARVLLRHGP